MGRSRRSAWHLGAPLLIITCLLVACAPADVPKLVEGPERPLLGTCRVTGTMQACANILTDIYLETDDAYERLSFPTAEQTDAIARMEEAAEKYASDCRSLAVRAGAEVNMMNGCDDALAEIVRAQKIVD